MTVKNSRLRALALGISAASGLTLASCDVPSGDGPARFSLTPVARFGDLDQGLQLQRILDITLSESGDTVFLVQWTRPFVLAVSASGDSLFTVGRGGGGPGEFGFMPGAVSVSGDTVFAADQNSSSLMGFVGDRMVARVQRKLAPLGDFQRAPSIVGRTPTGDLAFAAGFSLTPALSGQLDRIPWVVVGRADGAVRDTVLWSSLAGGFYQLTFDDGAVIMGAHPIGMPERAAVDPSGRGLVKARSVEAPGGAPGVALTWYGWSGDSLAAMEFPAVAASSDAAKERFVQGMAGDAHSEAAVARAVDEQMDWPALLPGVLSVFMDRNGRTWVQSPAASPDSARWYLVDRDRTLAGYVVLPERLKLMAALDDDVWGWLPGAYDEPIVMHFVLGR